MDEERLGVYTCEKCGVELSTAIGVVEEHDKECKPKMTKREEFEKESGLKYQDRYDNPLCSIGIGIDYDEKYIKWFEKNTVLKSKIRDLIKQAHKTWGEQSVYVSSALNFIESELESKQ